MARHSEGPRRPGVRQPRNQNDTNPTSAAPTMVSVASARGQPSPLRYHAISSTHTGPIIRCTNRANVSGYSEKVGGSSHSGRAAEAFAAQAFGASQTRGPADDGEPLARSRRVELEGSRCQLISTTCSSALSGDTVVVVQ